MRKLGLVLVLAAACGGGSGGGDPWDVSVAAFTDALCHNACVPADAQDQCVTDVTTDLDQARAELPDAAEAACLDCLDTKAALIPDVVAQGCVSNADQDAQVIAACDTDPANDDDGDGDPTNDTDEACAGFP